MTSYSQLSVQGKKKKKCIEGLKCLKKELLVALSNRL